MTIAETAGRQPGDRLVQMIWKMALTSDGKLPMPTIERVNAIRTLAATWRAEDKGCGVSHVE